jgi:hypothetical protein
MNVSKNIFGKWEVRAYVRKKNKNKGSEDMEFKTYSANSGAEALRMFADDMRKEGRRVVS